MTWAEEGFFSILVKAYKIAMPSLVQAKSDSVQYLLLTILLASVGMSDRSKMHRSTTCDLLCICAIALAEPKLTGPVGVVRQIEVPI